MSRWGRGAARLRTFARSARISSLSHSHASITGNKGSDRTKYGTHPLAPKSFVPHHMQRLSVAAVKGDAKGVRAAANSLKRKVMGNAASAAAVGARA